MSSLPDRRSPQSSSVSVDLSTVALSPPDGGIGTKGLACLTLSIAAPPKLKLPRHRNLLVSTNSNGGRVSKGTPNRVSCIHCKRLDARDGWKNLQRGVRRDAGADDAVEVVEDLKILPTATPNLISSLFYQHSTPVISEHSCIAVLSVSRCPQQCSPSVPPYTSKWLALMASKVPTTSLPPHIMPWSLIDDHWSGVTSSKTESTPLSVGPSI